MVAAYRLNEIDDFMTTEKQRVSSSATTYQLPSQQNFHPEDKDHFNGYDRDDLIRLVLEQQSWIQQRQAYVQDLEIYIDSLLIRVLDTNTQAILENPYNETGKRSHKLRKADDSQKKALDKSKKKRLIDLFKIWKQ